MKKIFVLAVTCLFVLSCSDFMNSKKSSGGGAGGPANPGKPLDPADPNQGDFSEAKMLTNIGLNVIVPATRNFRLKAEILNQDFKATCISNPDEMKERWRDAMMAYHFLNSMAVGPAVDKGRAIADSIYSWPLQNMCGVDEEVVKQAKTGEANHQVMFTSKGLMALEYLLFEPTLSTACNPKNPGNKEVVDWAEQKSADDKKVDRCATAAVMAEDLLSWAQRLEDAWDPKGENFTGKLVDGTRYPSHKEAINAVSDALFSLEKVKDINFAKPLGLKGGCNEPSGKCPQDVEHLWSGESVSAIEAELLGYSAIFHGSRDPQAKAFGFDDYMSSVGQEGEAQKFSAQIQHLLTSIREVKQLGTLQEQIQAMDHDACKATTTADRKVPACAAYRDMSALMKRMKADFLILLSLRAPPGQQGEGDSD